MSRRVARTSSLGVLLVLFAFAGCAHGSGGSGGDASTGAGSQNLRGRALAELPASTKGVVRIRPEGLASVQKHPLMANVIRTGVCTLLAQVGQRLGVETGQCGMAINATLQALSGESLEHLASDRAAWVALATTGHDELLRRTLWGIPFTDRDRLEGVQLHVRALLPAADGEGLRGEVREFCSKPTTPCPSSATVETTASGRLVRVDLPVPDSEAAADRLRESLENRDDPNQPPQLLDRATAARSSLADEEAAVVLYSRFRALADLSALEALYRRSRAGGDDSAAPTPLRAADDSHRASSVYAFHRPKSAEFEDVALAMGGDASGAWTELRMTPTEQGRALADIVSSGSTPPVAPDLADPHLRWSWNVETSRLLERARRPKGLSMDLLGYVLNQSITSQLQFTGYPFAQGGHVWAFYSEKLDHQPLVQAADRLLKARYLGAAARLEESDGGTDWRAAAAGHFPADTWSESDLERLREVARAFVGSESSLDTPEAEEGQILQFGAPRADSGAFATPDAGPNHPLEVDLEPVTNVRIDRPIARMILGAAPIRLRGDFTGEAAVVRLSAGEDVSPAPSEPTGDAAARSADGRWSRCILPVFRARHHAIHRTRSAAAAERASVWKETTSTVIDRLEACSGADWALEQWRTRRDALHGEFQSSAARLQKDSLRLAFHPIVP